ncbi:MAG: YjbQ family protein, partial [Croceibacterium sp.]
MHQALAILTFDTDGQGFREITDDVNSWIRATDIRMGQVTLFCQHTSASLLITENASPAVKRDILRW